MMTSTLCTCTWLLLPCCVLITLSTGELNFYRDELALRQLMKYLEGQRSHFLSLLANQARKKHRLDLDRQKERDLLEALISKGSLAETLKKGKPKGWNYRQTRYNEPINESPRERQRYFWEYSSFKLPYFTREMNEDDGTNFQDDGDYGYDQNLPLKHLSYDEVNFDRGMKEEEPLEFRGSYGGLMNEDDKSDVQTQKLQTTTPYFRFDSNLYERRPFAVKPNDPRYYQDGPFFVDDEGNSDLEESTINSTKREEEDTMIGKVHVAQEENPRDMDSKFKDTSVILIPELERRTEYNPMFVPVNQDLNNDIYFIAVVAGCSAAAMFALVLIALTWCRLKRGAKAAADIEYPAYGVTGPNKEVSPSGDQRLAQSAQMYHFQHQKQQIIAMENRVSATRDPGSVSEAESEEENEEGDYTVYECPGLAATGEMEVKNPLFHDDPTPATPAQTNKEEDHI
ncbi:uncharacterized protein LOC122530196 isoform X1 [Frieseomelitta varia]|uniref:uncharacterized protein LOC122530196 isoform X1 n=2 Tax=Frieseomelitta varia TaxID=561572 RepID=UPI001CB698F2|nr:uncharacterized protein LOC122530196 isoform X1 [Frieseomelitta varia]